MPTASMAVLLPPQRRASHAARGQLVLPGEPLQSQRHARGQMQCTAAATGSPFAERRIPTGPPRAAFFNGGGTSCLSYRRPPASGRVSQGQGPMEPGHYERNYEPGSAPKFIVFSIVTLGAAPRPPGSSHVLRIGARAHQRLVARGAAIVCPLLPRATAQQLVGVGARLVADRARVNAATAKSISAAASTAAQPYGAACA
jgi:hypothetical protein